MGIKINKKGLLITAYLPVLFISIVMFITFMAAFLNGGSITITINNYNEKYIELLVIPFTLIMSVILFKRGLKDE